MARKPTGGRRDGRVDGSQSRSAPHRGSGEEEGDLCAVFDLDERRQWACRSGWAKKDSSSSSSGWATCRSTGVGIAMQAQRRSLIGDVSALLRKQCFRA
eukprot:7390969-Prymnesium_polylepis.3